ncbi:MAG: site-specific integrase [Ardenticatenaceae bacterium]|nr:site-specific integrase [Ardenticatenaceae bacterium]
MSGSIFKRSDGRWGTSTQVNGKRKYIYGKTKREVQTKLKELQQQISRTGIITNSGKTTVADLLEMYLETSDLRPITRVGYERVMNNHILPTLGDTKLSKLTPVMLQNLYNEMRSKGIGRTVKLTHSILHRALKLAVMWELLPDNPCDKVLVPKVQTQRKDLWNREHLHTFLTEAHTSKYYPAYVVLITTGIRLAELSAIKWSDVNFDKKTLTIQRSLHKVKSRWVVTPPPCQTRQPREERYDLLGR